MTTPVCPAPAVTPEPCSAPETPARITLMTPETVAHWLHSLAPEDVCGQPQWPNACPLACFLNAQNGHLAQGASVHSDSYTLAGTRYPLPAWAQLFVARVDHAPAHWKRPATGGITAAEALLLLEGLGDSRGDGIGRQEMQDGRAGEVTRDDGQHGPHTGDGPDDGGAAVCGQDGATPPWLSWPRLILSLEART